MLPSARAWRQASIPPLYWAVGLAVLGVLCLRFYDFGFIFVRFLFGGAVGCVTIAASLPRHCLAAAGIDVDVAVTVAVVVIEHCAPKFQTR